jgi:hypothetical protein
MTAYYFAIKPSDTLRDQITTLIKNLDSGVKEPQHKLHTQISILMTDEVLDQLLMSIVNAMKGEGEGAGILGTLTNMLKSTVHMLIRQMLGKHDNAEVNRMAKYLRDRSLTINGEFRLGFPLTEAFATNMMEHLSKALAGEGDKHRAAILAAMGEFIDLATVKLYDEFVEPIQLGFILRKGANLGHTTINKGSHSAISRVFPTFTSDQIKTFAAIYMDMFIKV